MMLANATFTVDFDSEEMEIIDCVRSGMTDGEIILAKNWTTEELQERYSKMNALFDDRTAVNLIECTRNGTFHWRLFKGRVRAQKASAA